MQFEEFLSVIDLLKDTTKYEAKVKELTDRQQAIQESIATLGVVGDISKAKQKAEALVAKGEATVAAAKAEAEKILADAKTAYDKRYAEIQTREVIADQALTNYNTIKSQLASREDALRTQEKASQALHEALQAQQEELAIKQVELDARLEKLRQVMG